MTFEEFKNAVVAEAEKSGITDYELYYAQQDSTSVEAFRHEISEFSTGVEGGVCFRCVVGGHMGYASTEELSPGAAAALVRRAAENAATLESEETPLLVAGGQTYEAHEPAAYPLPDAARLVKTVLEMQDMMLGSDPAVLDNSQSGAYVSASTVAICNSRGLDLRHTSQNAALMAMPIVGDGQEMSNAYEMKRGDFAKIDRAAVIAKAVKKAKDSLGGGVPATGAMPVVFSPEAMSSLLGTFSSAFSSEMAQKGLSALRDKEGQTVAGANVTLVDDPFFEGGAMMPFDAEGSPTHKKNVIENGRLVTLLYNLQTAVKAGKATTGNAAKGGYASKVGVRPFVMYLAPGGMTEDELLEAAGNGVYINSLGGLHAGANPITGDFSLQSGGFLIENGKKTAPVKSFTVAGNFFAMLSRIRDIASNLEPPRGGGVTGFTSPSVLVDGLTVAGK